MNLDELKKDIDVLNDTPVDCWRGGYVLDLLSRLHVELTYHQQALSRSEQQIKELLWDDPEDDLSFGPAFGDLLAYLNNQTPFPADLYKMMQQGAKKWQQMKDELNYYKHQADESGFERVRYGQQLSAVSKERNELEAALKLANYIINGNDKEGGLVYCMDGYYSGAMKEELEQFAEVMKGRNLK